MVLHMIKGIDLKDDLPLIPIFDELLRESHLLISEHTQKYLKKEEYFPGPVINRANKSRWEEEGCLTLLQRAVNEVKKHVNSWESTKLPSDTKKELQKLMESEAKRYGMNRLPEIDL